MPTSTTTGRGSRSTMRWRSNAGSRSPERRQHALPIDLDRAQRVGARVVGQHHDVGPELLDLADALGVVLGVRGDDEGLPELVVRHVALALLVHRARVVPVIRVELVWLG